MAAPTAASLEDEASLHTRRAKVGLSSPKEGCTSEELRGEAPGKGEQVVGLPVALFRVHSVKQGQQPPSHLQSGYEAPAHSFENTAAAGLGLDNPEKKNTQGNHALRVGPKDPGFPIKSAAPKLSFPGPFNSFSGMAWQPGRLVTLPDLGHHSLPSTRRSGGVPLDRVEQDHVIDQESGKRGQGSGAVCPSESRSPGVSRLLVEARQRDARSGQS